MESFDTDDFAALGFTAENGDRFGSALASGDFDDDGYDDLAIAAPQKLVTRADLSTHAAAGVVFVLYGSPSGLAVAGQQAWHQGRNGLAGVAELDDRMGEALAAGDVDGDGRDDLAIGAPYEDVGAVVDAGGVDLLYGSAGGLTATSHLNLVWTQDTWALPLATATSTVGPRPRRTRGRRRRRPRHRRPQRGPDGRTDDDLVVVAQRPARLRALHQRRQDPDPGRHPPPRRARRRRSLRRRARR